MRTIKLVGIIAIVAAAASIYMYTPSKPVKSVNISYERTSLDLLNALKASNYDAVETFFKEAHTSRKLFENGRDVFYSVFTSWYASDAHVNPELLNHINAWVAKYPESPFAHMARAEFYYQEGWKARGGYWASLTSPDQWNGYFTGLGKAHDEIIKEVLPRAADLSYAYLLLVTITDQTNGYFDTEQRSQENFLQKIMEVVAKDRVVYEKQLKLLETAKSSNAYDLYGIHFVIMNGLAPRWGGSAEKMLSYAREVSKDVPADSLLPMLLLRAHQDLVSQMKYEQKKAYFAQPGVWDEVQWAFDRVSAAYPKSAEIMVRYAEVAYDAGKYKVSSEYMNRAYYTDKYYTPTYLKMGDMYMNNTKEYPMAERAYNEFLALRQDNPEPYRQLALIYMNQKKYDEAIALLDKGIALEPNGCALWVRRCRANLEKNDLSQAMNDCSHIIELDPYCEKSYFYRAKIFSAQNNLKAAEEDQKIYDELNNY